jgi:hypothetical protein
MVTEEQDKGRIEELFLDLIQLSRDVFHDIREVACDNDQILSKVNFSFCRSAAFVDDVIGVDQQLHPCPRFSFLL